MANETMTQDALVLAVQDTLSKAYANFAVALVMLFVGLIIGRLVGRLIHKILEELEFNRFLRKTFSIRFSADEIISNLVSYAIYIVSIFLALNQLGISGLIMNLILVAIILIIVASVLAGMIDFIPNLIAGIYIAQKRVLSKGDKVRSGDIVGEIIEITSLETRLKTEKGDIIYIPNSLFTKREVVKLKKDGF